MQIQADLIGVQIFRPEMVESTALGAAKLAALGVGLPPVEKAGRDRPHAPVFAVDVAGGPRRDARPLGDRRRPAYPTPSGSPRNPHRGAGPGQ